jgi:hypothetical protein
VARPVNPPRLNDQFGDVQKPYQTLDAFMVSPSAPPVLVLTVTRQCVERATGAAKPW